MSLLTMRLAIAAVGVAIWVYANRLDNATARWVGIAMLAVAVLLRFAPPRKPTQPPEE